MEGVRKRFGATQALDGVDLTIGAGEVLALVGENGAGKSTMMKVLSGAHSPDQGAMWLGGATFQPRGPADARRAGVSMIYQELSLALDMNVMENIALGVEPLLRLGAFPPLVRRSEMRRRAQAALAELGHANLPLDRPVWRLSVAERQVVEIARALASGTRVLVLDEPTSSLTQRDIERLFALVRRLRERGLAIVYISHFLEEVRAIADRFVVLRDGRTVGGGDPRTTADQEIIRLMVGRSVDDLYPRSSRQPGKPLLELTRVSGREKPTDASLALRRGEVVGIAGLIGSGRTELLRTITGLDPIRAGELRFEGVVGALTPRLAWSRGLGLVSEDRKGEGLALRLSIAENIALTELPRFVRPSAIRSASRRWIERLRIRCRQPSQPVGELSGGNQQKVALARLLAHDVDVLLLDEPTRGIDVAAKAEIYRLIDELATAGKAVLLVSSYLPELLGVCDRIAVMRRGRLGPARPVAELDEHKIMSEAVDAASAQA
jgi:ribose transport system ATP-binding protein